MNHYAALFTPLAALSMAVGTVFAMILTMRPGF